MATYPQTLEYLYALEKRKGMQFRLEKMHQILALLGHPEKKYKSILIGGSNGKGSTATMIGQILQEAGLRAGVYTSPHLERFTERVLMNGQHIPKEKVVEWVEKIRALENAVGSIRLSYFEYVTAMALAYFAEMGVEVAVLEVGLGGRLDATNAVEADVSVITGISKEHEQILGADLVSIAGEKAGIIKQNKPVITAEQNPGVLEVFAKKAAEKGAPLITVTELPSAVSVGLRGRHQLRNAGCAVEAVKHLKGIQVGETAIRKGLEKAFIPGRFEVVEGKPTVIFDGAHNPAGAEVLASTVQDWVPNKKVVLVLGMSEGKNYGEFAKWIAPLAGKVYLARAQFRGVNPKVLEQEVKPYCSEITIIDSVKEAYRQACAEAGKEGVVLVTGSLFVVGEARSRGEVVHSL